MKLKTLFHVRGSLRQQGEHAPRKPLPSFSFSAGAGAVLAALAVSLPGCADAALSASGELEVSTGDETFEAPGVEETRRADALDEAAAESVEAQEGSSEIETSAAELGLSSAPSPSGSVPTETAGSVPDTAASTPAAPSNSGAAGATMVTSGRRLLDSCGNVFVTRGVEQIFGEQLPEGNDWVGLVEQIASTGANAVRVLAGTDTLGLDDVDSILSVVGSKSMVAYVTPYGDEATNWLEGADVRAMLAKHERYIIIDAFGEPTFDDRERFVRDASATIRQVRSWGYRVPLTATANQFGRDLPSVLELGAEIVASDPLNNTIMGWQAYWSSSGYYQETYGMSSSEGVAAAAQAPFPIQLGLDRVTDFPSSDTADFGALMTATEAHGIGWLWWDWYNPYGNENNLTESGDATELTSTGQAVVSTHSASIRNTSRLTCGATN